SSPAMNTQRSRNQGSRTATRGRAPDRTQSHPTSGSEQDMTPAEPEIAVEIVGLRKTFNGKAAVDGVDLSVRRGETLVLHGPSGCGQMTTMRSLVGLDEPDEGRITIDGWVVFDSSQGLHIPANERAI